MRSFQRMDKLNSNPASAKKSQKTKSRRPSRPAPMRFINAASKRKHEREAPARRERFALRLAEEAHRVPEAHGLSGTPLLNRKQRRQAKYPLCDRKVA